MNILSFLKSVNSENTPSHLCFQLANEYLFAKAFYKGNFIEVTEKEGYTWHKLKDFTQSPTQNKCAFKMPMFAAECAQERVCSRSSNVPKKALYPAAFAAAENVNEFRASMRQTLRAFLKRWAVTGVKVGTDWRFFDSNAKGTPAYFKKMYWRCHDVCDFLDNCYQHRFFLTVTANPRLFSANAISRYQEFSSQLTEFTRYLNREFHAKSVVALESTFSALPHAHIIVYTNAEMSDIKERHKVKGGYKYIYDGRLKRAINKWWGKGFTELVRNARKSTADYLSKYVSKSSKSSIKALLKKEEWSKSDYKEVLTILLPVLAEKRQFHFPKMGKLLSGDGKNQTFEEFCTAKRKAPEGKPLEVSPDSEDYAARLRAYLIALCIKSPPSCLKTVIMGSEKSFSNIFGENPPSNEAPPPWKIQAFIQNSHCVSCGGCVMSRIMEAFVYKKPFYTHAVDNSLLFEVWLWRRFQLVKDEFAAASAAWLDDTFWQSFIDSAIEEISRLCGGAVTAEEIETALTTPPQVWVLNLRYEVCEMLGAIFAQGRLEREERLEFENRIEPFKEYFGKMILTLCENGVIMNQS